MKKLMMIALAACAAAIAGCRAIEVEKTETGYRIHHNSHWLTTEAESITGSIAPDGTLTFSLAGAKSSPSEEFVRSIQTYTTTITDIARLAAAAYNPASTGVTPAATAERSSAVNAGTNTCPTGTCTDGSCQDCQAK